MQPARQDKTAVSTAEDLKYLNSERITVDFSKVGAIPKYEGGVVGFGREMLQLTFRTNVIVTIYNIVADPKLKVGKRLGGTVYEVNLDKLKKELGESQLFIRKNPKDIDDFMSYDYWEKTLRDAKPDGK